MKYQKWIRNIEPLTVSPLITPTKPVTFSIIVPAFNTPDKYLEPMVESVIAQTYPHWQLCLVEGGSTSSERAEAIVHISKLDKRIKLIKTNKNLGIAGNTNAGIKEASGDYIAFLDHDDILAPHALNEAARTIANSNLRPELIYSDEDKLSENGKKRSLPYFKPDWSPDLFLSVNYIGHFVVIEKDLVKKINGLREGFDGSQDYDFLLRAIDEKPAICHIPKILYHWRMADGSTASSHLAKDYTDSAGRSALADYLQRNKILAEVVEIPERPTNYRLKYKLPSKPLVSIIIPFKDKVDLLKTCVESIFRHTYYSNFELILVSNNSQEENTHEYLKSLEAEQQIKIYHYDKPFNYSAVNNFGRSHAEGDLLLFMNNDMEVLNGDWLEELAGVAIQPETGAVGGWLFYPDKSTQHAGVILGMTGMAGHAFRTLRPHDLSPYGLPDWSRNFLAVTGACLMVKAEIFDKVGGFDEKFIVCGSDISLCLRIHEAGYRNIFWPYAKLTHFESQSVGSYDDIPPSDYDNSLKYYKPYLDGKDPYFNPNLDIMSEQLTIKGSSDASN